MSKYQSIAVIYGSDSSEWEVSCRSGEFTASRIDEFQYDVYEIFARFGQWRLVAMRKANSMRVAFPEGVNGPFCSGSTGSEGSETSALEEYYFD